MKNENLKLPEGRSNINKSNMNKGKNGQLKKWMTETVSNMKR